MLCCGVIIPKQAKSFYKWIYQIESIYDEKAMSLIDSFSYSLSNLISKYSVLTLYLLSPNKIIKKNGFAEENHNLKYILN